LRRSLNGAREGAILRLHAWWPYIAYASGILVAVLGQAWFVAYYAGWWSQARSAGIGLVLLLGLPLFYHHAVLLAQGALHCLFPRRILPKLEFENGIPDEARTLVVVPTVVLSEDDARLQVERLAEIATPQADINLRFALLSDFRDSNNPTEADDVRILEALQKAVASLNAQHRDRAGDRFFVLHRERTWNPAEGVWMGFERKRGKLHELNRCLRGAPIHDQFRWVMGDFTSLLAGPPIRYVLALDDDTWLGEGEAIQLIRTAAHPLNQAFVRPGGARVVEGYGMLRAALVAVPPWYKNVARLTGRELPARQQWPNTFLFDAFDIGYYGGNCLYDVDAVRACLEDALPLNAVLSHDVVEAQYARVGEVCDAQAAFAVSAGTWAGLREKHRWCRGDTQSLRWLLPRLTDAHGRLRPNPLPFWARLQIVEAFLRSTTPVARLIFLLLCWTLVTTSPYVWPAFALAEHLSEAFIYPLAHAARSAGKWFAALATRPFHTVARFGTAVGSVGKRLAVSVALLAIEAFVRVDAVARALWRMLVSHKHQLEWTPQRQVEQDGTLRLRSYWQQGWPSTIIGLFVLPTVILYRPTHMFVAVPMAALWTMAFAISWRFYRRAHEHRRSEDRTESCA
jgi:hypothetical protein